MMENIEVWQVYIFDGHSMHFSLAKNSHRKFWMKFLLPSPPNKNFLRKRYFCLLYSTNCVYNNYETCDITPLENEFWRLHFTRVLSLVSIFLIKKWCWF